MDEDDELATKVNQHISAAGDIARLAAECIAMLNQLRTTQSLMANDLLREVDVSDILPTKAKKDPLR